MMRTKANDKTIDKVDNNTEEEEYAYMLACMHAYI